MQPGREGVLKKPRKILFLWEIKLYISARIRTYKYECHHKGILADKLYFGDIGLRNIIAGGEQNSDIEKIIENAVKTNDRRYVQVAYIVADEKTEAREFGTPAFNCSMAFALNCS